MDGLMSFISPAAELLSPGVPGKSRDVASWKSVNCGTPGHANCLEAAAERDHGELFVPVVLADATVDCKDTGEAAGKELLSNGELINSPATSTAGPGKADAGAPSSKASQTFDHSSQRSLSVTALLATSDFTMAIRRCGVPRGSLGERPAGNVMPPPSAGSVMS